MSAQPTLAQVVEAEARPKFTPGPWAAERKSVRFAWDIRVPGLWIGEVASWCGESQEMEAEATANARLIAAAPVLYDALKDALEYLQHHLPDEALAPHRAALRLAEIGQ